jgi:hypothetical protein
MMWRWSLLLTKRDEEVHSRRQGLASFHVDDDIIAFFFLELLTTGSAVTTPIDAASLRAILPEVLSEGGEVAGGDANRVVVLHSEHVSPIPQIKEENYGTIRERERVLHRYTSE